MNIWAINKDLSIKLFLIELVNCYGENTFSLLENPDQFKAVEVYLSNYPNLSAYIYTFAQPVDKYAIDVKYPFPENNIIGENENLSLEQLISVCDIHFELTEFAP